MQTIRKVRRNGKQVAWKRGSTDIVHLETYESEADAIRRAELLRSFQDIITEQSGTHESKDLNHWPKGWPKEA